MEKNSNEKVLTAMSGGVDSCVAAKILKDQGFTPAGAIMKLFESENFYNDKNNAQEAAEKLGMEFYVFDFSQTFKQRVMDNFVETYLKGATPNPCIQCNKYLKFGEFLQTALQLGYKKIATGHYANKEYDSASGRWLLKRSKNAAKDQSYVLYSLTQQQLEKTLFPIGNMDKQETKRIAEEGGLLKEKQSESQDICFITKGGYVDFIVKSAGVQPEGNIILQDGKVIGRHRGLVNYTIGQRRGVGVSYSEPLFVVDKKIEENALVMGTEEQLSGKSLIAKDVNFIAFEKLTSSIECTAQTRYHQKAVECTVVPLEDSKVYVEFSQPHRAICKGQAVVFYDGQYVLGGGIIC